MFGLNINVVKNNHQILCLRTNVICFVFPPMEQVGWKQNGDPSTCSLVFTYLLGGRIAWPSLVAPLYMAGNFCGSQLSLSSIGLHNIKLFFFNINITFFDWLPLASSTKKSSSTNFIRHQEKKNTTFEINKYIICI